MPALVSGWNRILVKVRDHGGQWGLYLRLLQGNMPLTELPVSLHEGGGFIASQQDSDGDGLGDPRSREAWLPGDEGQRIDGPRASLALDGIELGMGLEEGARVHENTQIVPVPDPTT